MAHPVASVTHIEPARATAPVAQSVAKPPAQSQKPTQSQPSPAPADTVQISNAAKAALQEATETRAQTAQEAGKGDIQAQRLLIRETAGQKSGK
jgi:hypothetical protein